MSQPLFKKTDLIEALRGGLIVSCQPVAGGPMDRTDIVVAMAQAAAQSGARALRIEGVERVNAVAKACPLPIIGIVKRDLPDSAVRISPFLSDIRDLAGAGASVIAFDATDRPRPVPAANLLSAVRSVGRLAMADCATFGEAAEMARCRCDFVASTLSGYVEGEPPLVPDLELVHQLWSFGAKVIAEGRYNSPGLAAAAIAAGAHAVTVGSAITRVEILVEWFRAAVENASAPRRN